MHRIEKSEDHHESIKELKERCSKIETVLALVVEKMGMGRRSEDGRNMVFTGTLPGADSLHKSRTRGSPYLHLALGDFKYGKHWKPGESTTSN